MSAEGIGDLNDSTERDGKDENRVGRNVRLRGGAIAEFGRDDDFELVANGQELKSFTETSDDAIHSESRRFSSSERGVERSSIDQATRVVDLNRLSRQRRTTWLRRLLDNLIYKNYYNFKSYLKRNN